MATVVAVMSLYLVNALSPGPNLVLILQAAVTRGRREAVGVALGVTSGSVLLALAASTGLQAVLLGRPALVQVLREMYIGYIVYLGFRLLWNADRRLAEPPMNASLIHAAYGRGLATVVTNPQTALFFAGALTVAIPPDTPMMVRLACVGSIVVASLLCHGGTALTISASWGRRVLLRFKPFVDLLLGSLMIVFAIRMLIGLANSL